MNLQTRNDVSYYTALPKEVDGYGSEYFSFSFDMILENNQSKKVEISLENCLWEKHQKYPGRLILTGTVASSSDQERFPWGTRVEGNISDNLARGTSWIMFLQ